MFGDGPGVLIAFVVAAAIAFKALFFLDDHMKKWGILDNGRLWYCFGQGALVVVSFFVGIGMDDGDIFKTLVLVNGIGFAVLYFFQYKKAGHSPVGSGIVAAIQSALSIFGGVLMFFALSKASSGSTQESQQEETPIDPNKKAFLDRADFVAKQNGMAGVEDWVSRSGYSNASDAYDKGFFNDKNI